MGVGVAMASEKWFRTLDAREQAVYAQGLGDVADARRRARARVDALLEQLPKQGVQIYEPTAEEREAWRAACSLRVGSAMIRPSRRAQRK